MAELESLGKYVGGHVPPFRRLYRKNSKKVLIPDRSQFVQFRTIEMLRRYGLPIEKALSRVEELIAKREGRPAVLLNGVRRAGKWGCLPEKRFPSNSRGLIHPFWTKSKYAVSAGAYETEIAKWRKRAAEDRIRIRELTEK